jgi:hypothetical protein
MEVLRQTETCGWSCVEASAEDVGDEEDMWPGPKERRGTRGLVNTA